MCRFIETLRSENGTLCRLSYHQARAERTLRYCLPGTPIPQLAEAAAALPKLPGVAKVRIIYGAKGVINSSVTPYVPKPVTSLKLIANNTIDYTFKAEDRSQLQALHARRGLCSDVLIVRNGYLTDTSYANIALFDGLRWITPAHPLLCGTMRQSLLDSGWMTTEELTPADLPRFTQLTLINALLPPGIQTLPISAIIS